MSRHLPPAIATYYEALDRADMERAAEAFSADVLYAKPPSGFSSDAARVVVRGRQALLRSFIERGPQPFRHAVVEWARSGRDVIVEGRVTGLPGADAAVTFLASVRLDSEDRIARYVIATVPEPMVRRWTDDELRDLQRSGSTRVFAATPSWIGAESSTEEATTLLAGRRGPDGLVEVVRATFPSDGLSHP